MVVCPTGIRSATPIHPPIPNSNATATALRRPLSTIKMRALRFAELKAQEEKSGTFSGKVSAPFGQMADLLGVPESPIKVHTGTAYANARDLARGTPSSRWCYARRDVANSSFQPTVALGNQKVSQTPILFQAAGHSADAARPVGITPEVLADLSRSLCRFGD